MLLANLIQKLSEEELSKIRREFQLSQRSRMIFERIAQSPSDPPETDELVKIFRITKANFYSICSEIVDECVRILAPEEEFATMKFFRGKFLYSPFVTEILREEKRLRKLRDKKTLENFYNYVFTSLMEFPVGQMKMKHFKEYGKKLYRSKQSPAADDDLAIELKIIYLEICHLPTKKKMTLEQMAKASRSLLDPFAARAMSSKNVTARFNYFQAEWKACVFRRDLSLRSIEWVERTFELVTSFPAEFSTELVQVFELLLAYEWAMKAGKFTEALTIYKKYYKGQTPETSRGALYLKRFAQVAFLARDYETVHTMVAVFERYQFIRTNASIYTTVLILKAMVNIAEGKIDTSIEVISQARSLNDGNFFLAYEVQIRGLETLIALRQKNLQLAEQLVHRNIKWLRSRRISLSKSAWIYYYQVIEGILLWKQTGEPLREHLLGHFNTDFQSEHLDFFKLLNDDLMKIHSIH